jgi:hypothetical protein
MEAFDLFMNPPAPNYHYLARPALSNDIAAG